MPDPTAHHLGHDAIHTCWDASLLPRLTLAPGDTCTFATREASQGRAARDAIASLAGDLDPELAAILEAAGRVERAAGPGTELGGHALSGPVAIDGAEPGDTLLVEVVEIVTGAWAGHRAVRRGEVCSATSSRSGRSTSGTSAPAPTRCSRPGSACRCVPSAA